MTDLADLIEPVRVQLTKGFTALVDPEDAARVLALKWSASVTKNKVYACRGRGPTKLLLHRFIIGAAKGQIVDHKNGDGLDCRRCNIRVTDYFGNAQNRPARIGKHGYRGVHKHPQAKTRPYYAQVCVDGKRCNFGWFASPEEAAHKFDELARLHYGEFAVLNFGDAA